MPKVVSSGGSSLSDTVTQALRPDVLVTRVDEFRSTAAVVTTPTLVAEVLSLSNRLADLDAKLSVYRRNGLEYLAVVDLNQDETVVGIRWLRAEGGGWVEMATATGTSALVVDEPSSFGSFRTTCSPGDEGTLGPERLAQPSLVKHGDEAGPSTVPFTKIGNVGRKVRLSASGAGRSSGQLEDRDGVGVGVPTRRFQ
jgi:hypothetical protein